MLFRSFKQKKDLYNLGFFIQNARKKAIDDRTIGAKLKKAKWKGEQINYAMNKLDGKSIGMWELPFVSMLEKRKMQKKMLEERKPKRII